VVPGLVDAHCHIGLGPDGGDRHGRAPKEETCESCQAPGSFDYR
jgi:imidazolonepropionase-like amidohydrolase